MRLYVRNKKNKKQKLYLRQKASTRNGLAKKLGKSRFTINGQIYTVNEVYAEPDQSETAAGAVIGGLLGLFGGPIGVIVGGAAGGLIGNGAETSDKELAFRFNKSRYEKTRL